MQSTNHFGTLEHDENKSEPIESPRFNHAHGDVEMSICVYLDDGSSGFIGVSLHNYSDRDCQTNFVTFNTKTSPYRRSYVYPRAIIQAKEGLASTRILSHCDYKKWAEKNGDVLKLEVSVSLLTKEMAAFDGWTR